MNNFIDDKSANNANIACELCQNNYSHEQIIEQLESELIIIRQISILQLDKLNSQTDADKLVNNLTGQDGRIREVCAFKINELIKISPQYFQTKDILTTFLKGVIDVNPTVCRFIIEALHYTNNYKFLTEHLINQIVFLLNNINFEQKHVKKHILNKMIFKLYWTMEALCNVVDCADEIIDIDLIKIIQRTAEFPEYTIREKSKKIIKLLLSQNKNSTSLQTFYEQLCNDENFYVKLRI